MNKPIITFKTIPFEQNMDVIAMFIHSELNQDIRPNTAYFKDLFPQISTIDYTGMNPMQISILLQIMLYDEWKYKMAPYLEVADIYQNNWNKINDSVMDDLAKRLNIDWPEDSLDIQAFAGIMCSCPRNISNRRFYITVDADINTMQEIAIHEICHFLYFEKWKELYNDHDETHYDHPHIIWHLSEAIIDPLLNNNQFLKYTNQDILSYKTFYEKEIDGLSIVDNLNEIMKSNKIEEAIKKSYSMFLENEDLIKGNYCSKSR